MCGVCVREERESEECGVLCVCVERKEERESEECGVWVCVM